MKYLLILTLLLPITDNGQYKNSPWKAWFDQLASKKGNCCSFADGVTVEDPDWGTEGNNYWVVIDHKKIIVPEEALVTVANRFGKAVVWPYIENNETKIRCFMPGAGT